MINKKFNFGKVVWLILLCFGITLFSANPSQALPTPYQITLIGDKISATGPPAFGWYTEYTLYTKELGALDAFCVEKTTANDDALYHLIPVPGGLSEAAGIASLFFSGIVSSKAATQIRIWEVVFELSYSGPLNPEVEIIRNLDYSNIIDSIYLAQSPREAGGLQSQDYLVSVPDASIMFLLGPALLGLGLLGRRKSKK